MNSAVRRSFEIITLLRRSAAPLTLTEISRTLGIAASTAHGLVGELVERGALIQDDSRRFHVGPSMFYLGAGYHRDIRFYSQVWNPLVELADAENLTAVAAVRWGAHHLILNVHKNAHPGLEVALGGRVPLDAGAWGKAYFAWAQTTPADLTAYTSSSIVDVAEYESDLARVRLSGFAFDRDEFVAGAGAIATAVTSEHGFEGIIALVGSLMQRPEGAITAAGERLAALAVNASSALGDRSRLRVLGIS